MQLYSFGFNAFQQTTNNNNTIATCHEQIKRVLFTSWETTIVLNDADEMVLWGYKPEWFSKLLDISQNKCISSMFGDPNVILGVITEEGSIFYVTSYGRQQTQMYHNVQQVVYSLGLLYLLYQDGSVYQVSIDGDDEGSKKKLNLSQPVKQICGSNTHVLFLTYDVYTPIYGMGSNRLSQLGMDYDQQEQQLVLIDYFCGLGKVIDIACGPFHSAVIIEDDVYTFGWNKDGRLGWGGGTDVDIISCAVFLNKEDQPIEEIHAKKVVCGSSHTLVLDDQGTVWSCGSNKYGQLGREITTEFDPYFRQCTTKAAIEIHAGKWNSFIMT